MLKFLIYTLKKISIYGLSILQLPHVRMFFSQNLNKPQSRTIEYE